MKTGNLLLTLLILELTLTSCEAYKHRYAFDGNYYAGFTQSDSVDKSLSNLSVDDKFVTKLKDGSRIKGKIGRVGDSDFGWYESAESGVYTNNVTEAILQAYGYKINDVVGVKLMNKEIFTGVLAEYTNDHLILLIPSTRSKGTDYSEINIDYDRIRKIYWHKAGTANHQDIARIKYDLNVGKTVLKTLSGVIIIPVGVLLYSFEHGNYGGL